MWTKTKEKIKQSFKQNKKAINHAIKTQTNKTGIIDILGIKQKNSRRSYFFGNYFHIEYGLHDEIIIDSVTNSIIFS